MKIVRKQYKRPPATLEEFADEHGLVMQIRVWGDRITASFQHTEVRTGSAGLLSEYGVGATEADAMRNYAKAISEKLLIIDAYGKNRKEIWVPKLIEQSTMDLNPKECQ